MRKKIAIALTAGVAAATVGLGAAGTASAAPSANGECVQAGIGTLKSLNLLQAAAKKQIDYSTLDPTGSSPLAGVITVELPSPYYPSLGQVVKLHTTNPGYFTWCDGLD